jgi:hypothetical protein
LVVFEPRVSCLQAFLVLEPLHQPHAGIFN